MPDDRRALSATAAALAIQACAVAFVVHGWPDPSWSAAVVLHLAAVAIVLSPPAGEPSRRNLAAAMVFTLPVLGAAMAGLVVAMQGRGGDELLPRRRLARPSESGAVVARRITGAVPVCESLIADAETRRATLAALQRESDARAVALMRWSMTQDQPDLAIEAALALEELSTRHARRATERCAELDREPSREHALAAGDELAAPIHSGLAEPALIQALAAQARSCYDRAAALDPPRAQELASARARLELAALRPGPALALLEPALAGRPGDDRLLALYHDAAHAARRFDLLPSEICDDAS